MNTADFFFYTVNLPHWQSFGRQNWHMALDTIAKHYGITDDNMVSQQIDGCILIWADGNDRNDGNCPLASLVKETN